MFLIIIATIASFIAGFVDAVAGGGGIIILPTLFMSGLGASEAIGTNKVVSTFGTLVAARTFQKAGHISNEVISRAAIFTLIGATFGAYLVLQIPNDFLKPIAGVLILALCIYVSLRPTLGNSSSYNGLDSNKTIVLSAVALLLGFYDGFFGPGTGIFLTYFFVKFLKMDFVRAAGNTKVLNFLSNIAPLIYFSWCGSLNWNFGFPMAISNIIGGYIGAHSAIKAGPGLVRWVSIVMTLLLSVKMGWDYCH